MANGFLVVGLISSPVNVKGNVDRKFYLFFSESLEIDITSWKVRAYHFYSRRGSQISENDSVGAADK